MIKTSLGPPAGLLAVTPRQDSIESGRETQVNRIRSRDSGRETRGCGLGGLEKKECFALRVASPGFAYKKIEGSSDFKEGSVIGKVG